MTTLEKEVIQEIISKLEKLIEKKQEVIYPDNVSTTKDK